MALVVSSPVKLILAVTVQMQLYQFTCECLNSPLSTSQAVSVPQKFSFLMNHEKSLLFSLLSFFRSKDGSDDFQALSISELRLQVQR